MSTNVSDSDDITSYILLVARPRRYIVALSGTKVAKPTPDAYHRQANAKKRRHYLLLLSFFGFKIHLMID